MKAPHLCQSGMACTTTDERVRLVLQNAVPHSHHHDNTAPHQVPRVCRCEQ